MQVVDLSDDMRDLYFCCLEDWSDEMAKARDRKMAWFDKMADRGLRVKMALDDRGEAGGMIHYLPVEHSPADGEGLYFVLCIWVHGYDKGRGNFRGQGMGKAMLAAAEDDARALGAKGMAAWGLILPFWMKAAWFKKQGYISADRDGISSLVWKPFAEDAQPPRWVTRKKKPQAEPDKVVVTAFANGWCPGQNLVCERAKRAAAEFGDKVRYREIDTTDRDTFLEWGILDGLFINDKPVRTGPPPSYEKIKGMVARAVTKL